MTILHIGKITNYIFNGVCAIVPEYIRNQENSELVALWNLSDEYISNIKEQYRYSEYKTLDSLPEPFCKPDIVIFHEVYRREYLIIYKQLLHKGVPYVVVPHGSLTKNAQSKKWLKKKLGNIFLYNKFIYSSAAVQSLSDNEKNNTNFSVNMFVSTNGIYAKNIHKSSFNTCELLITYIGRLEKKTKGLDIMMEALENIHDFLKDSNVSINIFGPDLNGRYTALDKLIKEKQLDDIVTLNHEIIGEEKENQLLKTDYFIQTSRTEGMPTGILEAMSYGVPCIITEGTSLGKIIKKYDAGWVSETNSISLSNTIKKAIKERNKLIIKSNNSMVLCEKEFGWDKITSGLLANYENIINQGERL